MDNHENIDLLITGKRPLLSVESTATIGDALELMTKHDIRYIPVFEREKDVYHGILTAFDLLSRLCFDEAFNSCIFVANKDVREEARKQFLKTHITTLLGKGSAESMAVRAFYSSQPIHEVLKYFSIGPHSALVLAQENKVYLLTQTDVLQYMVKTQNKVLSLTVTDCHFKKPARTVPSKASALEAFRTLSHEHLSAVAIVDEELGGRIIGNLSTTDIRALSFAEDIQDLLLPLEQFLARKSNSVGIAPVFTCDASTQVLTVANALLDQGTHRSYIVDSESRPLSVVTMTDLIRAFDRNSDLCRRCSSRD
eukprot:TRINITY_DN5890_c0_g1::TRINITY_DN5890_c0_g1_i1::g.24408::m.24408 TRINITY_DN5890_c0_g1::TRINITY_DN5890_c0_g1_i1::g.24408  ORF type:complete len:333 (-),score=30.07,sp/Q8GXI9/PV42B_ARATH/22.00/9e-09,CBS/PF00571.23/3.1e-10,CBS/PF00571.23/2.1e+02,CBS/PF00571.23/2.2e-05,CBS/PF00571.23/1.1e-05 TRINITY_DN5890_c0_g1_i1:244-1173(-)